MDCWWFNKLSRHRLLDEFGEGKHGMGVGKIRSRNRFLNEFRQSQKSIRIFRFRRLKDRILIMKTASFRMLD
jgi:hypothetical protein